MTNLEFTTKMLYLQKYLDQFLDDYRLGIYWEALKSLSEKQFSLALENLVKNFVPTNSARFPYISQILEACGESGPRKAHSAIALLRQARSRIGKYDSVAFCDNALHYLVETYRGWHAVTSMSDKEWDINEGRMFETYKSAEMLHPPTVDHLSGLAENDEGWFTLHLVNNDLKNRITIKCFQKIPDGVLLSHSKQEKVSHAK